MKVSELSLDDVKNFLRMDETTPEDEKILRIVMDSAKSYITNYTGLPLDQEEGAEHYVDEFPDIAVAFLVLCQDMYDTRSMYVEKNYANKSVETILGMHAMNLV